MDMSEGYGDSGNPIGDKSQFVMSLFEQLDSNKKGITPIDRSIIDRCVSLVYEEARETKTIPTLKTLRTMLLKQPEIEARSLALNLNYSRMETLMPLPMRPMSMSAIVLFPITSLI